jgi:hypothetical protein
MTGPTQRTLARAGSGWRGLSASLCLHLALLGALLALRPTAGFAPVPEESVEVELVDPGEPAAATAVPAPTPPAPPATVPAPAPQPLPPETPAALSRVAPEAAPPPADSDAMVAARTLLADSVLAHPRSRGTRDILKTLDAAERIEQLCNLEAMGQIHAWKAEFEPDRVVAYAMASIRLTKTALEADGAAFRSRRHWYNLRFRCELAANGSKVAGFRFRVGEPIPRSQWAAHDLPPEH